MASRQSEPGDSPLLPPPTLSRSSPALSQSIKTLPPSQKKNLTSGCTHPNLTRLYDHFDSYQCSVCGRGPPEVPFLWRCTADTDGHLPESDFSDKNHPAEKILTIPTPSTTSRSPMMDTLDLPVIKFLNKGDYTIEQLNIVPHLSAWIIKAIGEGHYTHDEVKKMIVQKQGVWRAIRQDMGLESRPTTAESSDTAASSSLFSHISTLPTSSTLATTAKGSDEDIRRAYNWRELQRTFGHPDNNVADIANGLPRKIQQVQRHDVLSTPPSAAFAHQARIAQQPYRGQENAEITSHMVPCCNYKVCAICRPTLRERAIPSIDSVLNDPVGPPLHEIKNRPIANAAIMRQLGLPKPAMQSLTDRPSTIDYLSSQAISSEAEGSNHVHFHQRLAEDEFAAQEEIEARVDRERDDYIGRVAKEYEDRTKWDDYFGKEMINCNNKH